MITETKTTMKWYIAKTQANREKSISAKILKESENGDLVGKVGKCLFLQKKAFS